MNHRTNGTTGNETKAEEVSRVTRQVRRGSGRGKAAVEMADPDKRRRDVADSMAGPKKRHVGLS